MNTLFEKPEGKWKSRFNLSFKVPMGKPAHEVVIDGISIPIPDNSHGAYDGTLKRKSALDENMKEAAFQAAFLSTRNLSFMRQPRCLE